MANFIQDNSNYTEVRKFEETDPVHAELFNNVVQALVNNDAFVKSLAENLAERLEEHTADEKNPHNVTKDQVGLSAADNTSDLNKPISTATQERFDEYYQQLKSYTDKAINELINGAPTTLDTLKELADAINNNKSVIDALNSAIGTKANAAEFDSHTKTVASGTVSGHVKVDTALSSTSANPVQNAVVKKELDNKVGTTGNASDTTVTFSQASGRTNIASGEKLSTILGKISKFFTDLKNVAFSGSYNDLNDKPSTTNVTQTATDNTVNTDYRVLLSNTADDTTRTEAARKNSRLKFNPSTGTLSATKVIAKTEDSTVAFTSNDTTSPTAWTDVTVLSSNEKHSSLLNKISIMFKNIRWMYKILGNTDISKIENGTVTGILSTLNSNFVKIPSAGEYFCTVIGQKQAGLIFFVNIPHPEIKEKNIRITKITIGGSNVSFVNPVVTTVKENHSFIIYSDNADLLYWCNNYTVFDVYYTVN